MRPTRDAAVPSLTDALWQRYRSLGDPEARRQLLDHYLGLVHHTAREMTRRVPADLELDDLVSAGTLGLVQALEGFDPSRGLAFSTYAMPRIRGAMLDELRGRDWMPRSVRTHARQLAQARAQLRQRLGRAPEPREVARTLGVDLATYWRWADEADGRTMVTLNRTAAPGTPEEAPLVDTIPDGNGDEPGEALTRAEALSQLREAFAALPHKDRLVLTLYYYEELTLRQIGDVLHITESRVSQIRTRALQRLREQVHRVGGRTT
jgi:RNA polymerase sigma factor for flagellar operon FliA